MPSLKARGSALSSADKQIALLENTDFGFETTRFAEKLLDAKLLPLKPTGIDILQVNMGKMCNQTCNHCHVDAGPDRKEIMSKEVLQFCLDAIVESNIETVDLTGGAPEMNPHFRWFVAELHRMGTHVIDRCNLTIITANPKYNDLPVFLKENQVEVVSSMPHYTRGRTDRQRGNGVFERSIRALRMLNQVGYGQTGTDLQLNLVYNPAGAFLPGDQEGMERDFKSRLQEDFGIVFNKLFCITNMPISRYLEYLINSGNYESYMKLLIDNFNPQAAQGVMCRNTISVGWDGYLYDCDFNQMLDLKTEKRVPQHISQFHREKLGQRSIAIGQHCFGCTAGSGSSCGGETTS